MNIFPSLKEFKKLIYKHNLIVLSYKFYCDWLTPPSLYYRLSRLLKGESFLLESVEGDQRLCRFSFLGFLPLLVFKSKGKYIYIEEGNQKRTYLTQGEPLTEIKRIMDGFSVAPKENLRFFGGLVGYLGYDLIRFYEPIGEELNSSLDTFDTYFILPKFLIILDHLKREIEILSFVRSDIASNKEDLYRREVKRLKEVLEEIIEPFRLPFLSFKPKRLKVSSNFKKKDFLSAVEKAKAYIKEGEVIQVVLSQRFSVDFKANPFNTYRYLRILNPSPYMFYLNFKDLKLAGSSPEMLLRCEKDTLITRPIAGTRKRSIEERVDKALEEDLLSDHKERAEHLMLVDLARNDLGRVAEEKSVSVPIFMSIERFSHVMHIVSEVRAKLKKKGDIFKALISCFPAGTVSGAPKVRAMQIINTLERERRGLYAGAVGYFSFTNSLDTCIIIRSIIFKDDKAYFQAGAGIVYDSVPIKEYQETINKSKAQLLALELSS